MIKLCRLIILAVLMVFVVVGASTGAVSADEGKGTIIGSVTGVMKMPKSAELKKSLEGRDIAKFGWHEGNTHYLNKVRLNKATVLIDDIETMTDENGLFKLDGVPAGEHTIKVLSIEKKLLNEGKINVKAGTTTEKHVKLVYEVGKGCCGEETSKDSCADCGETQTKAKGLFTNVAESVGSLFSLSNAYALYPCRDYNGGYGNCVNYSSGSGQYTNFIGSDCQTAMARGFCWEELMPGYSCAHFIAWLGRYENCSPLVGHSYYHHCH